MNKQELWKKIINIAITILTAIATTFGVRYSPAEPRDTCPLICLILAS